MSVAVRQAVQLVYSLALTNRTFHKPRISTREAVSFVDSLLVVIDDYPALHFM